MMRTLDSVPNDQQFASLGLVALGLPVGLDWIAAVAAWTFDGALDGVAIELAGILGGGFVAIALAGHLEAESAILEGGIGNFGFSGSAAAASHAGDGSGDFVAVHFERERGRAFIA